MEVQLDQNPVFDNYLDLWDKHDKQDLLQRKEWTQKFPSRIKIRYSYGLFCGQLFSYMKHYQNLSLSS